MKTKLTAILKSDGFKVIRREFDTPENQYMLKFFDPLYIGRAWKIVELLGLHHKPKMSILDIGSGFAYFPYLCRELGHDVVVTDVKEPLYDAVTRYLGFDKIDIQVRPFEALPIVGDFNYITALKAAFYQSPWLWAEAEWDFFYSDIRRLLQPRGILYITGSKSMSPMYKIGDKQHLFNGALWKIK